MPGERPLRAERVVAVWQLVGGAVGLTAGAATATRLIAAPGSADVGALALVLIVAALHAFAVVSGGWLWRGARFGYVGSLTVQCLQLTMITTSAHASFFRLLAALYVEISGDIVLLWRVGSGYAELLATPDGRPALGINLFALGAVALLLRSGGGRRRAAERADEVFR